MSPKTECKIEFPSLFLSFRVNSSTTHLMWANVSQTKFISCTDIPERSLINALDGDLGADEKPKRLCKNNASHPHSGCCLRQRNDTSGEENEQLCVLIDHRTSSTQLGLSYQDVLSLLECIKSLHPTKQLEQDVLWKVAGSDDTVIELIITHCFVLPAETFRSQHSWGIRSWNSAKTLRNIMSVLPFPTLSSSYFESLSVWFTRGFMDDFDAWQ